LKAAGSSKQCGAHIIAKDQRLSGPESHQPIIRYDFLSSAAEVITSILFEAKPLFATLRHLLPQEVL